MDRLFKALYFAGVVAQTIIRAPYERQRHQQPKVDQRVSRTERGLLAGLTVGMLVLPLIYSLTKRLDFANYRLSPRTKAGTGGLGTLALTAALWLFWRSHHDLGTNWSPSLEINQAQTLTTHGVYGSIRHPMYASGWLLALAQALLLQNWLAGPTGLVVFLLLYRLRVPQEERMMRDHFGAAYEDYCTRTGRIVPRL